MSALSGMGVLGYLDVSARECLGPGAETDGESDLGS